MDDGSSWRHCTRCIRQPQKYDQSIQRRVINSSTNQRSKENALSLHFTSWCTWRLFNAKCDLKLQMPTYLSALSSIYLKYYKYFKVGKTIINFYLKFNPISFKLMYMYFVCTMCMIHLIDIHVSLHDCRLQAGLSFLGVISSWHQCDSLYTCLLHSLCRVYRCPWCNAW